MDSAKKRTKSIRLLIHFTDEPVPLMVAPENTSGLFQGQKTETEKAKGKTERKLFS